MLWTKVASALKGLTHSLRTRLLSLSLSLSLSCWMMRVLRALLCVPGGSRVLQLLVSEALLPRGGGGRGGGRGRSSWVMDNGQTARASAAPLSSSSSANTIMSFTSSFHMELGGQSSFCKENPQRCTSFALIALI